MGYVGSFPQAVVRAYDLYTFQLIYSWMCLYNHKQNYVYIYNYIIKYISVLCIIIYDILYVCLYYIYIYVNLCIQTWCMLLYYGYVCCTRFSWILCISHVLHPLRF